MDEASMQPSLTICGAGSWSDANAYEDSGGGEKASSGRGAGVGAVLGDSAGLWWAFVAETGETGDCGGDTTMARASTERIHNCSEL